MKTTDYKEIVTRNPAKTLEEVIADGNRSFDESMNYLSDKEDYRRAYLVGWIGSAYRNLYDLYTNKKS
jgi:hypothetical protein